MISADELMKCREIPLDQRILKIVAENEPIRKHQIPDHFQTSLGRAEVFLKISEMGKASLIDIGDAEEGCIVMLTPEGRTVLSGFEATEAGHPADEPKNENAGAAPESSATKKSLIRRVVDFLILHPGSTRDQLKKQFPDELKALSVALCEGRRNDRISMRKDGEIETFHPGPNALAKLAPNHKPPKEKHQSASPVVLSTEGVRLDRPTEQEPSHMPSHHPLSPDEEKVAIDEARRNGETRPLPTGGGVTSEEMPAAARSLGDALASSVYPDSRKFRVARTSDATIIIWGVSPAPIELDAEQSRVLADFIVDWG